MVGLQLQQLLDAVSRVTRVTYVSELQWIVLLFCYLKLLLLHLQPLLLQLLQQHLHQLHLDQRLVLSWPWPLHGQHVT